jgi:hypothetical protein
MLWFHKWHISFEMEMKQLYLLQFIPSHQRVKERGRRRSGSVNEDAHAALNTI